MTIKMTAVDSTSLAEIGYRRRTMHVKFVNGKTYELKRVPRVEFDRLRNASSKGKHFLREIKAHYPSVEISV